MRTWCCSKRWTPCAPDDLQNCSYCGLISWLELEHQSRIGSYIPRVGHNLRLAHIPPPISHLGIGVFQLKPGLNLWKFWRSGTLYQLHEKQILHIRIARKYFFKIRIYVSVVKISKRMVFLFLLPTIKENSKLGERGNWSRLCNLSYFPWQGEDECKRIFHHYPHFVK